MTEDNKVLGINIEQQALRLMKQARPESPPAEEANERRARLTPGLIAHVRQAPAQRRRKRVWQWSSAGVLAAAAGVALWLAPRLATDASPVAGASLVARAAAGDLLVLHGTEQRSLAAGQSTELQVLDQVRTMDESSGVLTLPTGSRVQLSAASSVEIAQLNPGGFESVRLKTGSVHVRVPKLSAGEYFAILTDTAKVVVHGTDFTVDVGEKALAGGPCVQVAEGLVAVHGAEALHWVSAGKQWGCRQEPEAEKPPVPTDRDTAAPTEKPVQRRVTSNVPSREKKTADLAQANKLFQQALTHYRRGEWAAAKQSYQQLLSRFPDSPVASEARVQLGKLKEVKDGRQ